MTQELRHNGAYIATVYGEPASKANSRSIVKIHGQLRVIKSKKARDYAKAFSQQVTPLDVLLDGDVVFGARIFYKTRRPDLDESLIMDLLEGIAYANDRQIKAKVVLHALDKHEPRVDLIVAPLSETQDVFEALTSTTQGE